LPPKYCSKATKATAAGTSIAEYEAQQRNQQFQSGNGNDLLPTEGIGLNSIQTPEAEVDSPLTLHGFEDQSPSTSCQTADTIKPLAEASSVASPAHSVAAFDSNTPIADATWGICPQNVDDTSNIPELLGLDLDASEVPEARVYTLVFLAHEALKRYKQNDELFTPLSEILEQSTPSEYYCMDNAPLNDGLVDEGKIAVLSFRIAVIEKLIAKNARRLLEQALSFDPAKNSLEPMDECIKHHLAHRRDQDPCGKEIDSTHLTESGIRLHDQSCFNPHAENVVEVASEGVQSRKEAATGSPTAPALAVKTGQKTPNGICNASADLHGFLDEIVKNKKHLSLSHPAFGLLRLAKECFARSLSVVKIVCTDTATMWDYNTQTCQHIDKLEGIKNEIWELLISLLDPMQMISLETFELAHRLLEQLETTYDYSPRALQSLQIIKIVHQVLTKEVPTTFNTSATQSLGGKGNPCENPEESDNAVVSCVSIRTPITKQRPGSSTKNKVVSLRHGSISLCS
jgi:hypothetical protein